VLPPQKVGRDDPVRIRRIRERQRRIAAAGKLLNHDRADAVVLTVWEPLVVEALRANRFGGWPPIPPDVTTQADQRAQKQAQRLAEHGARLAGEAGFEARALWVADERRIAATILDGAD
jgi:hypothetical protein